MIRVVAIVVRKEVKTKLKKWKLIWRLLFNPMNKEYGSRFNEQLSSVLLYALNNYSEKRGEGASEVLFYGNSYGKDLFTS